MENRRILVVDDYSDIHEDFKKILLPPLASDDKELDEMGARLLGGTSSSIDTEEETDPVHYTIDSAFQGDEAVAMVVAAFERGEPYALVFMDVRMPPGIDGVETSEKIWQKVPNTEIVICSAYSDYSWAAFTNRLGKSDHLVFLRKPFEPIEIKQLALTLTTKWNVSYRQKLLTDTMDSIIRQRSAQLEEQQNRMVQSEKMAALGTMSAGIAHEINSPLAVILLSAEQGKDLSTDPNIDRLFTVIEDTSKRIVTIIKGLLKFTHSSEKEQPEKITEEDLINDTLTLCKQRFADNFVELSFGRSGGPFWINGHSVQLVQVLVSLLNNSFDAVKDLKEKWVKLEVSGNDTVVELVVTDSGMMIPAEIQAKVFDPFFTTKEVGSGTGLGLSIAKGIIESHQGTINLDTHSEHTRFVIQLPTHASQGTR